MAQFDDNQKEVSRSESKLDESKREIRRLKNQIEDLKREKVHRTCFCSVIWPFKVVAL